MPRYLPFILLKVVIGIDGIGSCKSNYHTITTIIAFGNLTADNSVFPYSNANGMHVTQDLNSFREIIAHAHCSVDEKNVGCK
jgi:hypothetical protein